MLNVSVKPVAKEIGRKEPRIGGVLRSSPCGIFRGKGWMFVGRKEERRCARPMSQERVAKEKRRYAPFEVIQETPREVALDLNAVGDGFEESLRVAFEVVDTVGVVKSFFEGEVILALASETVLRDIDGEFVALEKGEHKSDN